MEDTDTVLARAKKYEGEKLALMSPRGALNLPSKLEEARWKYGLVDSLFDYQAAFDAVFVYQVEYDEGETFGGGLIHKPDVTRIKNTRDSHIGVLVSAGLTALDALVSHGIELGDRVIIVKMAPFAIRCGFTSLGEEYLLALRAGDILGSAEIAEQMRAGQVHQTRLVTDGRVDHRYTGACFEVPNKCNPFIADDQ